MTKIEKIIKGLEIIHSSNPDAYVCAEHDEIFAGDMIKPTPAQTKELKELGWMQDGAKVDWSIYV